MFHELPANSRVLPSGVIVHRPEIKLVIPDIAEEVPSLTCLLEGGDLDSLTRLSFYTRDYDIPEDANNLHYQGSGSMTLIGRWTDDGVTKVDMGEVALKPVPFDLGKFFSMYSYGFHSLFSPDGRIFHTVSCWEVDDVRWVQRIDRTLDILNHYFSPLVGMRNPLRYTDIRQHLPNLQQLADIE